MVNVDLTGKHHVLWNRERSPQPFYINNFIGSCSQGNLELEVHLGLVADIHQEYTYVLPSEYLANMVGWCFQ